MKTVLKKLCLLTVLACFWSASIQAKITSAQTTGLGWDGYTRQLWRASDQHIALWVLDPNFNYVRGLNYGPYLGWSPVSLATGNNNYSYMLWRTASGNASIWLVDPNLNYVNGITTAANPGWTPESISTGTNFTNLRLTWRRFDGAMSIWSLDAGLNYLWSAAYGPYYGYDPGPAPEDVARRPSFTAKHYSAMPETKQRSHTQSVKHADAVKRAAKLMSLQTASKEFPTLPKL